MCNADVEIRDNVAPTKRYHAFQEVFLATIKRWSKTQWLALSDMITDFRVVARGYEHPDLFALDKDWYEWEVAQVINITPSNMPLAVIAEIVYLREKISDIIK